MRFDNNNCYLKVDNTEVLELGKNNSDFTISFALLLPPKFVKGWKNIFRKGNNVKERTPAIWRNDKDSKIFANINFKATEYIGRFT